MQALFSGPSHEGLVLKAISSPYDESTDLALRDHAAIDCMNTILKVIKRLVRSVDILMASKRD